MRLFYFMLGGNSSDIQIIRKVSVCLSVHQCLLTNNRLLLYRCIPGRHHANRNEERSGSTSAAVVIAMLQQQQPHPLNKVGDVKLID